MYLINGDRKLYYIKLKKTIFKLQARARNAQGLTLPAMNIELLKFLRVEVAKIIDPMLILLGDQNAMLVDQFQRRSLLKKIYINLVSINQNLLARIPDQ